MAAEDDEGDTFRDFKFPSFPPNPPPTTTFHSHHLPPSNAINSSTDDDKWGDFVEFPPQLSSTQSEPSKSQSADSKMMIPTRWVKPSGALPLALFGDAEEEEHEDGSGGGVDLNSSFDSNDTRNGSDYKCVGNTNTFGVNDIIANLYNQTRKIKFENGSGTNSSPSVDSNANDLILDDKSAEVRVENGFYSSSKLNAVSLGFSEWNLDFNGMNLNSNVNGTKNLSDKSTENGSGTNSNTRVDSNANDLVLDSKSREVKVENGFSYSSNLNAASSLFSDWNMDFNGMNSIVDGTKSSSVHSQQIKSENFGLSIKSNGSDAYQDGSSSHLLGGWTLELNKLTSNFDKNGREKELDGTTRDDDKDDDVDEGWEFKDAYSEWRPGDVNNMVRTMVTIFLIIATAV